MSPGIQLLGVFVAGGLGACLRVGLASAIDERAGRMPLGTLVVNLLGCFAIGVLTVVLVRPAWRTIAVGGLLGGFTTYSSFALLSWEALGRDRAVALAQIAAHLVGGLVAVALGVWLAESLGGGASR